MQEFTTMIECNLCGNNVESCLAGKSGLAFVKPSRLRDVARSTDLEAFVGVYYSEELDVDYFIYENVISLTYKNNKLYYLFNVLLMYIVYKLCNKGVNYNVNVYH